ncbi:MAG: hypothetical protein H3C51_04920 [Rubellimicrobium sp.]|nr:hypothetical protein [Rubellimicrobium sp.]
MTPLLRVLERRMPKWLASVLVAVIYAILLALIVVSLGADQEVIRYIDPRRG